MKNLTELDAEMAEIRETLGRVARDAQAAMQDITVNGIECMVTVHDSHGREITKKGINPSVRALAATERTTRILKRNLNALTKEKDELVKQAAPSRWARFAPKERA
jgi:hypothetical protein